MRRDDIKFNSSPTTVDISRAVVLEADDKLIPQPHLKSDTSKRGLKLRPFAADMLLHQRPASRTELVKEALHQGVAYSA